MEDSDKMLYHLLMIPFFSDASSVSLSNDELIVGIKQAEVVKAYPHYILDWHKYND